MDNSNLFHMSNTFICIFYFKDIVLIINIIISLSLFINNLILFKKIMLLPHVFEKNKINGTTNLF